MMENLVRFGPNVIVNPSGRTPLHLAIESGKVFQFENSVALIQKYFVDSLLFNLTS